MHIYTLFCTMKWLSISWFHIRVLRTSSSFFQHCFPLYESESEVAQLCPTLCDCMDCSLPDSSVHGIFWARILEWVAISFSRRSSPPRDRTRVSCIVDRCFTIWTIRKCMTAHNLFTQLGWILMESWVVFSFNYYNECYNKEICTYITFCMEVSL